MIDKSHLRTTMLALTGAELTQAHKTYERFLASARPKPPPIWPRPSTIANTRPRPR
jgi:hypothetical protein